MMQCPALGVISLRDGFRIQAHRTLSGSGFLHFGSGQKLLVDLDHSHELYCNYGRTSQLYTKYRPFVANPQPAVKSKRLPQILLVTRAGVGHIRRG